MARYGKKAQQKVKATMHEFKEGTLKSGSGRTVKNPKQAIAIGLSEARKSGAEVPSGKPQARGSSGRKKSSQKK